MARLLAHLTDLHLLAAGRGGRSWKARFVMAGRALDAEARGARAKAALAAAKRAGADHLLVTGDLTETGDAAEFETFAEALAASGFAPERVTLVPGNHDRYGHADAWARALEGPLASYAATSASSASNVVDLGSVRLLPIDVTRPQAVTRSAGFLEGDALEALAGRLSDPTATRTPVVIVQHHPPVHRGVGLHWLDGLIGFERLHALLERRENVQIVHGHLHRRGDRPLFGRASRILGAPAVVESGDEPHLRFYEVTRDGLADPAPASAPALAPTIALAS